MEFPVPLRVAVGDNVMLKARAGFPGSDVVNFSSKQAVSLQFARRGKLIFGCEDASTQEFDSAVSLARQHHHRAVLPHVREQIRLKVQNNMRNENGLMDQ